MAKDAVHDVVADRLRLVYGLRQDPELRRQTRSRVLANHSPCAKLGSSRLLVVQPVQKRGAWRTACNVDGRISYWPRKVKPIIPSLPIGSLAEAFQRYRGTPEWSGKAPATCTVWLRAWAHIEPVFGDFRPRTVTLEHLSMFREAIEQKVSRREAHRVIKIWRHFGEVRPLRDIAAKMRSFARRAELAA